MDDLLTDYLTYTSDTESHKVYHRWSLITSIGAALGRSVYIPFGHSKIYPTLYTMLLGEVGGRKSSAIKLAKKLFAKAGYEYFSADRTSREKFLLDLAGIDNEDISKSVKNGHDVTDINLWGSDAQREPREVYIVADEFNEFISAGNIDFYTTLGNLWDWDDETKPYTDTVKNSKSASIYQPTVSLLGGNTQENFARAFPPEILGHGFLARLLLIHGIPSGRKIAFPITPPEETTTAIIKRISGIQREAASRRGELLVTTTARLLLEKIYNAIPIIQDTRFRGYNSRRYTQLLRLCIITATSMGVAEIGRDVVVYANTMLSAAELKMPESIGEFGKSRNSDVAHRILGLLNDAKAPVGGKQLWALVHKDLERMTHLSELMKNLQAAEKVQYVTLPDGKSGWLPKREVSATVEYVDWSLLTQEERDLL